MPISVYISNTSVKAVYAKFNRKNLIIKNAIRHDIPEGLIINGVITNEQGLSDELRKFFSENNLPLKKGIQLVISGNDVMSKTVRVPHTNYDNIMKIIKSEYSDIENSENSLFDYTVINSENPDHTATVLACAVSRDIIESYINVFKTAGISISSINTDINSEIKLMRKYNQFRKNTFMLAVVSGNVLAPALFANGTFIFSNRSRLMEERGTQNSAAETASVISSFIQFNKAQKNKFDISDVYFCGLNNKETDLCRYISDMLAINVNILPECDAILSDISDFRLSEYVYNVGNLVRL